MQLYLIGGGVLLLLGLFAAAYLYGRRAGTTAQQAAVADKTTETQDGMLRDSTMARDPAAVADRLRRGEF